MSKTSWIIFSSIVALLFAGLIAWTRIANPPIDVSGIDTSRIITSAENNYNIEDNVKGNTKSSVVLVEYGDFQCPSCAAAHPNVETLVKEYGDRIALVFRNYPLTTIHPNARAAAGAAEAAGLQGKYWEMHDLLFTNNQTWSTLDSTARNDSFASMAGTLGLDVERFKADLSSSAVTRKISFDQALAKKDGVQATPTFIINGAKLDEDVASSFVNGDLAGIKSVIDKALSK